MFFGGGTEGQYQRLESDAGYNMKLVEVTEERGRRGLEFSQERAAIAQVGDGQRLDLELRCVLYDKRLDPADVVKGKFAGAGHNSEVWGEG